MYLIKDKPIVPTVSVKYPAQTYIKLLFRWIIPVVLIRILNKSVRTSSTAIYIGIKITHET